MFEGEVEHELECDDCGQKERFSNPDDRIPLKEIMDVMECDGCGSNKFKLLY